MLATSASQSLPGRFVDYCERPVPLLVRHMPSIPVTPYPSLHEETKRNNGDSGRAKGRIASGLLRLKEKRLTCVTSM